MSALVIDLPNWTQIELTGLDRQSFLNGFVTNDVKKLRPGEGCEVFLSNIKGRVIGHVWVFAEDDRLSLEGEPGQAEAVIQHLDKYLIAEDVQITNRTQDHRLLLIAGDGVSSVLESVGLPRTLPAAIGAHAEMPWEGTTVSIRRTVLVALPNWTISASSAITEGLRSQLAAAGALLEDIEKFESLRIEHGYPLFGVDLSEDNLVHESSRVRQTVSFTKGCYLGQEPIARLDSLGHVNRHLCRLRVSTTSQIAAGTKVLRSGENGQIEVGHVTSAAPLLSDNDQIAWAAIALVKRDAAIPGTELLVDLGHSLTAAATVAAPN